MILCSSVLTLYWYVMNGWTDRLLVIAEWHLHSYADARQKQSRLHISTSRGRKPETHRFQVYVSEADLLFQVLFNFHFSCFLVACGIAVRVKLQCHVAVVDPTQSLWS